MYAGLRRGELMALRWEDVELVDGTIHVARGWDREGSTSTKNRGRRRVPITAALREHLAVQRLRQTPGVELVFGLGPGRPFDPQKGAGTRRRWVGGGRPRPPDVPRLPAYLRLVRDRRGRQRQGAEHLPRPLLRSDHFDRYGHLMPGSENEAAGLLDAYLAGGS